MLASRGACAHTQPVVNELDDRTHFPRDSEAAG